MRNRRIFERGKFISLADMILGADVPVFIQFSQAFTNLANEPTWEKHTEEEIEAVLQKYIDKFSEIVIRVDYDGHKTFMLESTLFGLYHYKGICDRKQIRSRDLREMAEDLLRRFDEDLPRYGYFAVTPDEGKVFDNPFPFGEQIHKAFPKIHIDMEESAKCFALDRFTACVSLSMRVVEYGVERLAKAANVDFYDAARQPKGWHKLLDGVESKLNRLRPHGDKRKERYKDSCSLTVSHLFLVKQLRNATQHPKEHYTKEQASAVQSEAMRYMGELRKILPGAKKYLAPIT